MTPRRILQPAILFLTALFALGAQQQLKAQALPKENLQASGGEREEEEGDFVRQRNEWFWNQRTFPSGKIPANAHHLAVERTKQLREENEARMTKKASKSSPASGPNLGTIGWLFDGPTGLGSQISEEAYSARVPSFAVDPNNAGTIYIGTAGGGVWKTTDGGTTWAALTDSEPSLSIGAVAVDPNNSNNIYAGTGESDFSGDSWYGEGMLESTNAGSTWTQVLTPFTGGLTGPSFSQIAVEPGNSSIVLAATTGGLYRSADQGATWTNVLANGTSAVVFDTKNSSIAYAAGVNFNTNAGMVYKSADSGQTWTALSNGFPTSSTLRIALAEDAGGTTLFTSIAPPSGPGLLYKTSLTTISWTALSAPPAGDNCCDWYRNAIAVDPANASVIYVAGTYGDFSLDGGNTWNTLGYNSGSGNSWADKHWFAFVPNGSTVYIGSDGGLFSKNPTDPSTTVTSLNLGIGTMTFYPGMSLPAANVPSSTLTLVGAQDHGLDGFDGGNWGYGDDDSFCGDGMSTYVDKDGHTAYAQCRGGGANWISNNTGGQTYGAWAPAQTGITVADRQNWVTPLAGDPEVDATVYTGTYRVYQTTNSATSWTPISNDLTTGGSFSYLDTIAVAPSDSNYAYAGSSDGMFSKTTNATAGAAAVWTSTAFTPQSYITKILVLPDSPTDVFVTVSGFGTGHVFHSTDAVTFNDISGNLPDVPVNGIAIDSALANTYYVATDTGAFYTEDGGTTWAPLGTGLPNVVVQDIGMTPSRVIRVVTHGRGAWDLQLPGGATPSLSSLGTSASSTTYGQSITFTATITSNPAGGATPTGNVTFMDGTTTLGTSMLNSSGVATYATMSLSAGSHSITADYSGDVTYQPSNSTVTTETVGKAGSKTLVTSSALTTNVNQAVTLTATVTPANAGTPTGNVQFLNGSTSLGSSALNGSGVATLSWTPSAGGSDSITASYAGDTNFNASTSGAITENVAGISVTAAAFSPTSVNPGQTATAQITLAPLGGLTGSVNLTCAITPSAQTPPTCSLSPTSLTLSASGSSTSTLTFTTTSSAKSAALFPAGRRGWWAIWLLLPAMLLGAAQAGKSKAQRAAILAATLILCLIFLPACGGSGSSNGGGGGGGGGGGTTAGGYTVTVTATSGSISQTATGAITVN